MRHCIYCLINFILLSATIVCFGRCQKETVQRRLYNKLLLNYRKYERPVKDLNSPIKLSFIFELIKVYEVEWKDYHLRWNSSDYEGFSSINIPPAKIWVPDVGAYNEITNKDHKKTDVTMNVMVSSDGTCRWSVPTFLQVLCSVDVSFFPLDLQHCSISFGSLAYSASEIYIKQGLLANSSHFIRNGEWLLYQKTIKTSLVWDDIRNNDFTVVEVSLKLERNSVYYFIEMFVPCLLISGLTILGFILPPESGERMSLGMLILLAMTFFQQLTMNMFPLQDFPLISKYFFVTTLEIGVALLVTTLTINFYYCKGRKMPQFLKTIIHDYLGKITRIGAEVDGDHASKRTSFRSNITNTEMHFEVELAETCSKVEVGNENLGESSVGLIYYKHKKSDKYGSDTSSRSSDITPTRHEEEAQPTGDISNETLIEWNKDWVLAAKIIDRFAMYSAVVIGIITILGLFLQSPALWRSRTDLDE